MAIDNLPTRNRMYAKPYAWQEQEGSSDHYEMQLSDGDGTPWPPIPRNQQRDAEQEGNETDNAYVDLEENDE